MFVRVGYESLFAQPRYIQLYHLFLNDSFFVSGKNLYNNDHVAIKMVSCRVKVVRPILFYFVILSNL